MAEERFSNEDLPWDQSGFEALKAGWSWWRRFSDQRRLSAIFNLSSRSPTLKLALDWAKAHNIRFFIDRTAANCGGYYTQGTGVVAISARDAFPAANAVEIIVHEIRHAWQDYNGLLTEDYPTPQNTPDFIRNYQQLALTEADAYAHGVRAGDECTFTNTSFSESRALRRHFMEWYTATSLPASYGEMASRFYGCATNIYKGPRPNFKMEFMSPLPPLGHSMDTDNVDDVLHLGQSFSGVNYLADARDTLEKKILNPSLAATFYNAANDNQRQLTAQLIAYDQRRQSPARMP